MTTRTHRLLAAAGLAAALTVGAGTAAFAADGSSSSSTAGRPAPTAEQIEARCAKVPTVLEKLASAKTRLGERLAKLQEARTAAEAAGKTKRVERIDTAIARVQDRLARIDSHTTKATDWSAAHCSPATTPDAPVSAG